MDPEDAIKAENDAATRAVIDELKTLYKQKLLPVEQTFMYNRFYSPLMTDSEFESKPMVLLIGQYSTGKTTFIRYLLGCDFPNQRIGPEPTTDRFVAVIGGEEERVLPGNALCMSPDLPFRGLEKYGIGFLNHFEGSQCSSKVLENITLVDSPGILAGKKQGERGYEFKEICQWFAERCDLILLLFDAHKLDISDEFQKTVEKLKGHEDKIRCVLNKADQIDRQRLMRVYGALMWGMGKVLRTPEVLRVYIGSFWNEPLVHESLAVLFETEENDLMKDLRDLPRNSAVRKINELVKRARLAKVNAHIVSYLKQQMPVMMGHKKKQDSLLADLGAVFRQVMKMDSLSPGDFPDIAEFSAKLAEEDFTKFPKLTKKHLDGIEELLAVDIPRLMSQLPQQQFEKDQLQDLVDPHAAQMAAAGHQQGGGGGAYGGQGRGGGGGALYGSGGGGSHGGYGGGSLVYGQQQPQQQQQGYASPRGAPSIMGGSGDYSNQAPPPPPSAANPFAKPPAANPFAKPAAPVVWPPAELKETTDVQFASLGPVDGKLSGDAARPVLMALELEMDALFAVWELSDHDADGNLDDEEFCLALWLCEKVKQGEPLPAQLPPDLVPPSHR